MSPSKSKCWYSNNCLHILKQSVPLTLDPKVEGSNPGAVTGSWKKRGKESLTVFNLILNPNLIDQNHPIPEPNLKDDVV
jgi:hypothetical protein